MPTTAISSGTEEAIRRSASRARSRCCSRPPSAGVLAVVYLLVHQLGLPDWVLSGAIVLLLIGLPIILVTGHLERRRALARASGRVRRPGRGPRGAGSPGGKAIRGGILAFATLAVAAAVYTAMRLLGIGPVGTLVASGRLSERDRSSSPTSTTGPPDASLAGSVTEAFRIDLGQSPVVRILEHRRGGRRARPDEARPARRR